jgi:hypothetical protein
MSDQEKKPADEARRLVDFQLFQLATLTSVVDNVRYRIHHLEVTMKGDKAGPYEASQIPPPLTPHKAFDVLTEIWQGCTGEGPEIDELLMGTAEGLHHEEGPAAGLGVPRAVAVPGLDTELPFELETEVAEPEEAKPAAKPAQPPQRRSIRRAPPGEDVLTLEPDHDADESGVIELPPE